MQILAPLTQFVLNLRTTHRTECFSLLLRLHDLLIRQGSFYMRNVMIQPGPLTLPPELRSFRSPSFRLIDFGRGERFEGTSKDGKDAKDEDGEWVESMDSFRSRMWDEQRGARKQLLIENLVIGF